MKLLKGFFDFQIFLKQNKVLTTINMKLILFVFIILVWFLNYEFISNNELLRRINFLFFSYLLLNIIFTYGKLIFIHSYIKKNRLEKGTKDNFTLGINKLAVFLNTVIFSFLFIHVLIINIVELITTLSIVAVALVLIFKEYISNFLSGLNLMFSQKYRIKDTIKYGEFIGKIVDITYQNIEIKINSGDSLYIPNAIFLSKEVVNFSKSSLKNISFDVVLQKDNLIFFEKISQNLIENIFEKFKNNIVNIENININYSKVEKDTVNLNFDIYIPKYSMNIEKAINNYINRNSMLLLYKEIDENKKENKAE